MSTDPRVESVCDAVRSRDGDVGLLVTEEVSRLAPLDPPGERAALAAAALARLRGLGNLEPYLHDPEVDEVLVNAGRQIWIDRGSTLSYAGDLDGDLRHLIERILSPIGRRADATTPIVDARLPDRSRVCAVVPPVAVDGPNLSIRRFPSLTRDLVEFTGRRGVALCDELVARRSNVVISGATSSGKTSLLASLVARAQPTERIVVIEDTSEIPLPDAHVVRLEGRPPSADGPPPISMTNLIRTALRLRPDRLVVGEVRGHEVLGLVNALNTGHDGSLSTCHANSAVDALFRLETLLLQAAPSWPLTAIRRQLGRSVDVLVHVRRTRSGKRRIQEVVEVGEPRASDTEAGHVTRTLAVEDGPDLRKVAEATRGRQP